MKSYRIPLKQKPRRNYFGNHKSVKGRESFYNFKSKGTQKDRNFEKIFTHKERGIYWNTNELPGKDPLIISPVGESRNESKLPTGRLRRKGKRKEAIIRLFFFLKSVIISKGNEMTNGRQIE